MGVLKLKWSSKPRRPRQHLNIDKAAKVLRTLIRALHGAVRSLAREGHFLDRCLGQS